uniref:X protein n=1 Tax=Lechcodon virus TaxID=3095318 RepID=A0AAU0QK88_9MONO
MPFSIYEEPYTISGSVSNRSRPRKKVLDYKCLIIVVLSFVLTITIILSFTTIWYTFIKNQAGYPPSSDSRTILPQGRIDPTKRVYSSEPNRHPFRPGIPGRSNCEDRTIQEYP